MKRMLLLLFTMAFAIPNFLNAQAIPGTTGHNVCDCPPIGWTTFIGNGGKVSSRNYFGGENSAPFYGKLPTIPGTPVLPQIPSGASTFMGLRGGGAKATVTGLKIGKRYKFSYSIISALVNPYDPLRPSKNFTPYATFRVLQGIGAGETVAMHKHLFHADLSADYPSDINVWRSGVFEFVSKSTTAVLVLEDAATSETETRGVIGLDLGANPIFECYSGTDPVPLKSTSYELPCGQSGVSLVTEFFGGLIPSGAELRFFTNATHSGPPVASPNVGPGMYYAFFYDPVNNCYNQDISTAKITVTAGPCDVKLNLKVGLQGSMAANGIMRNDLQTAGGSGVLPLLDPYGNEMMYNSINNASGVAGAVVDWVKVEIRSAQNPSSVLEAKSLLLKTNGTIVDLFGQIPSFVPQAENVRIVIKHRNHLPVMGQAIPFAAGTASYDFTTALNKAFNDGSAPNQMILNNGVWCIIMGDAANDQAVDNSDVTTVRNAFNNGDFDVYSSRDLNMDGGVDNTDVTIERNRFNAGYFSILINY